MPDANKDCTYPEHHHLHICELKKNGMSSEIVARSNNPGYICHNCNATANRAEDLCNCSPFSKRS
jgi:hypothetical protein